ncbi:hypothetical protein KQX54_003697 [Cotesia glomerata]|uniref:Uncharacterized protein n=1 Tax=Cotesia glomerata TaxID=32391 RepID=A0AAV7J434_COTGL|nr:hypothetical protein KQX54_003697 [Cotesia glomerata]
MCALVPRSPLECPHTPDRGYMRSVIEPYPNYISRHFLILEHETKTETLGVEEILFSLYTFSSQFIALMPKKKREEKREKERSQCCKLHREFTQDSRYT